MSELQGFGPVVVQRGTVGSYRCGLGVTTSKRGKEVSVEAVTASVTSELVSLFNWKNSKERHWGLFMKANMLLLSLSVDLIDSDRQTVRPIACQVLLTFIFKRPHSPVLRVWFPRWCCVTKHLVLFFSKFYQICLTDRPDPASVCLMCSVAWHGQRESPSITQHILTIVN